MLPLYNTSMCCGAPHARRKATIDAPNRSSPVALSVPFSPPFNFAYLIPSEMAEWVSAALEPRVDRIATGPNQNVGWDVLVSAAYFPLLMCGRHRLMCLHLCWNGSLLDPLSEPFTLAPG